ncbi:unnamed protein product [Rotaria sp. Silwood2]|nr:unnamed protein product [Rotaria sp. Silwood2]
MSNTTSLIDKESLKNLDASQAYADNDGVFDCILNKSSSEEQQVNINQINNIPKFICGERVFFNMKANALDRTYKYVHDGITWRIPLPDISSEIIIDSLLSLRSLIVRIGILYLHQSTTRMLFGSGLLLNNQIVLTCAHNFDPINWGDEMIALTKIYVSSSDPASPASLSGINPNSSLMEAQIIQRGLKEDNISNLDELKSNATDLAILKLNHPAPHLQFDSFFDPKFSSSSNVASVNCKLFLAGYNGELYDKNDLNAYKYTKGFEFLTIDKLNYHHNVDNKSI